MTLHVNGRCRICHRAIPRVEGQPTPTECSRGSCQREAARRDDEAEHAAEPGTEPAAERLRLPEQLRRIPAALLARNRVWA